jgi:tetratricopeptide (TPR) repeat protein
LTKLLPWAALAAAFAAGIAIPSVRDEVNPPVRPAGLDAHDTAAGASLLGQFRTSAASWLFLRADLYLHNGVEMRPLTNQEMQRGRIGVGVDEDHELHGDELNMVTTIPSREHDIRGVFGDIERATSAYKDMTAHKHNDPMTTLPLFRLMTYVDAQFVPGYTTGATIMAGERTEDAVKAALEFLEEGRKNNPQSIEILAQIGVIYTTRLNDIERGLKYYHRAAEIGTPVASRLSENERDGLELAYRWLALSYNHLEDQRNLRRSVEEGLQIFPEDPVLLRYAIQLGMPVNIPAP